MNLKISEKQKLKHFNEAVIMREGERVYLKPNAYYSS